MTPFQWTQSMRWYCGCVVKIPDLLCVFLFSLQHDDVIKWKHFLRYWPFVRGIHRSPVNSPHKGQWRGALMFSLICVWINRWVNNRKTGYLRRYRARYDVTVMNKNAHTPILMHTHSMGIAGTHGSLWEWLLLMPLEIRILHVTLVDQLCL